MNNLAYAYDHGEGVAVDFAEAERWYLRAAEAGVGAAMWSLSLAYASGAWGDIRYPEGARYLLDAAKAGHATSQQTLRESLAGAKPGMRQAVQSALAERGFYNGAIDGSIGPGTRAAIEAFLAE